MSNLPNGFYVQDVYCYPYGQSNSRMLGYIPGTPELVQNKNTPEASLMTSPNGATLALTLSWSVNPLTLGRIQRQARNKYPEFQTALLEVGHFVDPTVSLEIKEGNTTIVQFDPQASSGLGSFQAVFQEQLTAREKDLVTAALHGQTGILIATYTTELNLTARIDDTIAGDLAPQAKALVPAQKTKNRWWPWGHKDAESVTIDACRQQIDDAVTKDRLSLTSDADPNVSAQLRTKVATEAKEKAAQELYQIIQKMGADVATLTNYTIDIQSQGSEQHTYTIVRHLDIGAWFHQHGGGVALIQNAPTAIDEPNRS